MSGNQNYILLDKFPETTVGLVCEKALRYALFSLSFTVNRMQFAKHEQRLLNIFKGKIAEGLFLEFLKVQGISVNAQPCETPYYMPDKRDFLLAGYEWDIKNNFLLTENFDGIELDKLPALIPDRFPGDQWTKRNFLQFKSSKGLICVFTFMPRFAQKKQFISLHLSDDQLLTIQRLCNESKNRQQASEPYTEQELEHVFFKYRKPFDCFYIYQSPLMLITSVAGPMQWQQFEACEPGVFANGIFKTRIRNRYCEVGKLPNFRSLFPKKLANIHWS